MVFTVQIILGNSPFDHTADNFGIIMFPRNQTVRELNMESTAVRTKHSANTKVFSKATILPADPFTGIPVTKTFTAIWTGRVVE